MQQQQGEVRFIRKGGRVIPIRVKKDKGSDHRVTAVGAGAAAAGAAVAADAARTRQIYSRNGVTIERKKFSIQPFQFDKLGDSLVMRKDGKKIARASWYSEVDQGKKYASFSWLGVKKEHRGKGYSQTLTRVAAHDMKKAGNKYIWNQVVHPGSIKVNAGKNDVYWKMGKGKKDGRSLLTEVTQNQAKRNLLFHRKTKGIITSDIFRETQLKGRTIMPGIIKPTMARATKFKFAAGLALAAAGLAGAFYNEKD